ncbi:unnamed protein product [Commensalibacter communis]|uniref:Uncharacterized protein n=1 Tax=Commensalibacter communis TaxID=2972786 RepID=A0A9W4TTE7_9PROT|nr:hypothetical protein [Commensalibacter communis]CAI3941550.1 unnamed protein product [Commensalibacter communis]CAI3945078.1 unnamed protein product [Commensalibacter communis]CAI3959251.1 unnamed protein product [Commensalibacter communis]CAI3960839.1 unnamed protein product [Commensalibacter communis]
MSYPAFVEISEWQKKKIASDDLINHSVFVALNVPVACGMIRTLIDKLEIDRKEEEAFDGATENFLYQLKYIAHALEQDAEELHQSLIDAGHKKLLYRQD